MARFAELGVRIWFLLMWLLQTSAYKTLSDDSLRAIPGPGKDFDIKNGAVLAPILIPRVSGTEGSTEVLNHFADFFKDKLPKWRLSFQNSTSKTPATGSRQVPFINLIATREPPGAQSGEIGYLTLVAHYDSKLTPHGFIGAIDSAAPCAMIMHAARAVEKALEKKWATLEAKGEADGNTGLEASKGVQIILLDGEEAFVSWTDTDSIYGARSLAAEWENTFYPALSTYQNPLSSISLFVLLDLLGSKSPTVPSYFKTTHWAYEHMANLETRLRKLGLFKSSPNHPTKLKARKEKGAQEQDKPTTVGDGGELAGETPERRDESLFLTEGNKKDTDRWLGGLIGDDHTPFLARGVEILHLIASPFPKVWHEMIDTGENLDMDTVEDWALLVSAFVAEWMELDGFMSKQATTREPRDEL